MIGIAQQKRGMVIAVSPQQVVHGQGLGGVQKQLVLHNPLEITVGTLSCRVPVWEPEESRRLY
jgi:hypothetical protein